jgi:class 3 adenylate cyclase
MALVINNSNGQEDISPPQGSYQDLADRYDSPQDTNGGEIVSILNPPKDDPSTVRRRVSYAEQLRRSSFVSSTSDEISGVGDNGSSHRRGSQASFGSSRRSSTTSFADGIWGRLQRKSEVWEMESEISLDDEEHQSLSDCLLYNLSSTCRWVTSTLKTAFTTMSILVPCVLLFVTFSVCGILITNAFESSASNSRKQQAVFVAEQTDQFFVRTLERAFVPLFSMAQFIQELDEFHLLDSKIGDRCDPSTDVYNCTLSESAPVKEGLEISHRDLTDLFNSEYGQKIQKKFDSIASGIKENSGLGKSLVNIQVAPKGVVSLLYPMVNCEDFDGWCMNNTGAWGHDLLNDPNRVAIAEATVPADGVVTAGPLPLLQGGDTFIARLAINMEGGNHSMVVSGVDYPCWGFAVVLVDWERLKQESNIYQEFASKNMQFKLTRTDIIDDQPVVTTIAESPGAAVLEKENVTLALDTGDNGWVISVGYDDGFSPNYKAFAYPLIICSAFLVSVLMMLVLVSKKQHEQILGRLLPKRAIQKLRKREQVVERYKMVSIFFSDIVGYTKLSSEMTPTEVMKMLNDLYTKFDELAVKHKVYKLETIGDAYIAIGGAPKKCPGPEAAERVALFALDAIKVAESYRTDDGAQVYIRAGIASGPIVAGVVGNSLPKYTVFGDTVNFAARMEQTSVKMRLQISPSTQRMLLDAPNYDFQYEDRYDENGELGVELKGKGRQYTYWVNGAKKLVRGDSESTPETCLETGLKEVLPEEDNGIDKV